jgi:Family of unknown function (DUF6314)
VAELLHRVPEVATFLLGSGGASRWSVVRELVDLRAGLAGRFEGIAVFAGDGAEIQWDEAGELDWPTHHGEAGRRLVVVPDGAGAEVRFHDGRPFHPLDLTTGRCDVVHDCAPDRYTGEFAVLSGDEFHISWDVEGPAKRLAIRSTYRRLPAS